MCVCVCVCACMHGCICTSNLLYNCFRIHFEKPIWQNFARADRKEVRYTVRREKMSNLCFSQEIGEFFPGP